MEQVIPTNWLNKILLTASIACMTVCVILEYWFNFTSLPLYVPLIWSLIVITVTTWLSCIILKITLKATAPLNIEPLTSWLRRRLEGGSRAAQKITEAPDGKNDSQFSPDRKHEATIEKLVSQIDENFVGVWYDYITDDRTFRAESKQLLKHLFKKVSRKLAAVNETRLTHKLTDVLLLHLKEYRRSLRRIEKGSAKDVEEAYRCTHPGSRSSVALEHTLHRMVTLIAREFLQWELTSSLSCKLLISILAKRLLTSVQEYSDPQWLFRRLLKLLKSSEKVEKKNGIVSKALTRGITSVTAPVIPRPLVDAPPTFEITEPDSAPCDTAERSALSLEGLSSPQKGLWAQESEDPDDDGISPVYEEPTDFATTIARLRSLLQQKSTATTPLHAEEKSYVVCEGSQFTNLAIPWTEFHTAPDGSQQLLYCIQFDDIEQHGEDLFETTTATVRRQYSDFAQLHSTLEEMPEYSSIITEIKLPEGGRQEMETYLRTLCARLSDAPVQLRHFLRPSSGGGKKADAVAPRLDRFLAKTVTGVFNTLRTVVPGFEMEDEEVPLPTLMPLADIPWRFVEDVKTRSLAEELKQLVAERIDYCSVDTAYEAVDTVEGSGDSELLAHWWETANCPYDEELDEIDAKLMMTSSVLDILCEILAGIGSLSTIRQEAVIRWIKLFFGSFMEGVIQDWIQRVSGILKFDCGADEELESDENIEEKLVDTLVDKIYGDFRLIFGGDELRRMVSFFVKSLSCKRVNSDLALQILDVGASELLAACRESKRRG